MKYLFSFISALLLLNMQILRSQNVKHDVFMVSLSDKNNSTFSVFHPEDYLSLRALERRAFQQIEIDERDLPVSSDYISKIEAAGGAIVLKSKWLNAISVYIPDSIVQEKIRMLPFVRDISPLGKKKKPTESKWFSHFPHEEYKKEDNYYGTTLNQIAMLSGHVLHNMGETGQNKHVAIFDGGFLNVYRMPAFDSLFADSRILGTRDFVEADEFVYEASGHGTNVLSCMAANLPYMVMGTAPGASYYLFKTEDVGSEFRIEEFNWVAAVEYADSLGVDVVNSSLGYSSFNDAAMNYKYEDLNGRTSVCSRGADIAVEKGMLIVNSAGNEGDGKWHYIGTPADGFNVISVGAVRANGGRAPFSSFGPTADGRIKPNIAAQGSRAVVAAMKGHGVSQTDGTSFSSPIMAGMVTTLWSAFPNRTNWEIKDAIEAAGSQTTEPDSSLGYGIPDFFRAYLSLMDAGIAITAEGQIYTKQTLVKDKIRILVETNKTNIIKYTLCNKLGSKIYEKQISSGPYEVQLLELDLLSRLPADVYYIKIEVGTICRYAEIVKE